MRAAQGDEAVAGVIERTVLHRALRQKHETEQEHATTADEESAEQRRRRHVEHRAYLTRLQQEAREREQAALRAIALKEGACRLAQERVQELTCQRVVRAAGERKEYQRRRSQCLEAHERRREQRRAETDSWADSNRSKDDRLREHQHQKDIESQARPPRPARTLTLPGTIPSGPDPLARTLALNLAVAPTQARARHLEEQLETQHYELQEIIASKRQARIRKLQLTAARSAQQLESCRARGAAAAFDRHSKYDATYGRALQRRDDSLCMRQGQISDSLRQNQGRTDGLLLRRQQRDFEAVQHTYGQLRTTRPPHVHKERSLLGDSWEIAPLWEIAPWRAGSELAPL